MEKACRVCKKLNKIFLRKYLIDIYSLQTNIAYVHIFAS